MLNRVMIRASGGRVGTKFRRAPVILLTTTGRTTGKARTWPLVGLPLGPDTTSGRGSAGWAVAASNGGHDAHPAWYLNLVAQPEATVEEHGTRVAVRGREATGAERDELWAAFVRLYSGYAAYEQATDRAIPVVVLESIT
jgi:deazaflavin-dependent oxidoreductase (nitroreductase family)